MCGAFAGSVGANHSLEPVCGSFVDGTAYVMLVTATAEGGLLMRSSHRTGGG